MTQAQVINLSGQAWAVNSRGERRPLKQGDQVRGDEMVVTDVGASIELDLNGAIITLQGEHSSPLLEELLATPADQPLPSLDSNWQDSQSSSNFSNATVGEGGYFVQLVRIAEVLESDGFSPVVVKRIEELLKPLGMSYPDRSRAYEEEREYLQRPTHSNNDPDITAAISIDVIAGDDIINAAEADGDITISGTVGGNVKAGDTVTITVNGKTYETTVNPDGKTWQVDVPGSELIQDSTVDASVTTKGSGGKTATADTERPYEVDTQKPQVKVPNQKDEDSDSIDRDIKDFITDNKTPLDELDIKVEGLPPGLEYDRETGKITGKIDKSSSQGGNDNDGSYTVTIIVTDKAGNTTESTFEWEVTNPEPIANDDKQTIQEDTSAIGNVLTGKGNDKGIQGQDSDPDGDDLKVIDFSVGGNTYQPGETVEIPGVGKITMQENGDYVFTPEKDYNGPVPDIGYTISDGEGGADDAVLTIVITPVNDEPEAIKPEVSLDRTDLDADSPIVKLPLDNLFKDVDGDELTYDVKDLPPGLKFDPKTGEITGTIDKSASQGGPDGDGKYTVTITATDPDGLTAEQTFTWTVTNPPPAAANDEGDTFKTVELNINADNGVLKNDTDPDGDDLSVSGVVAGAATNPSASGVNTPIKGAFGTLVLQPDGSYVYTPDLSNDTVWQLPAGDKRTDTFTYTVSDGEGGFATAELVITINGHSNTPPFLTPNDENGPSVDGEITVYEKGLTAGSDPGKGHVAGGIINVSAMEGLKSLTIGGTELTLTDLANLSGTPVTIAVAGGTLTLIGFEPLVVTKLGVDKTIGGKLNYSYELTTVQDHAAGDGNNSLTLDIQLAVKDDQDAVSAPADNKLIVNVIDDVPHIDTTTHEPMLEVDETTLGVAGQATVDFAGIFTPSYGADSKGVADKYTLIVNAGADSGLVDTATGTDIKLYIAADGSIEGRVGAEDGDVAFKLSVNANGKVTLTQNSAVKHPNSKDPDDKVSLKDSGIKLELKITDTDYDTATESADIGKFIGFKDDGPTLNTAQVDGDGFVIGNVIVDEKHLPSGSASDAAQLTVTKELPINFGADGAVNANGETGLVFANTDALGALKLKSGNTELTYVLSADGHTITAKADSKDIFTIELKMATDGTPSYEFILQGPLDHTLENDIAANIKLPFDITATDGDGDSVDLKFKVEVVDDTPKNEVRELTVDEDGAVSFSNADINNSTTKITSYVKHGTVTIGNDGKITYTPNEDYRGSDSYTYTVTTASGTYERTVNITVKPVADAPLFADRTDGGVVVTPEDTEKSLGLKLPAIKDIGATGQNDPGYSGTDYSELLGAITLTPSGAGYIAGDTKFTTKVNGAGAEIELKPVGGKITIVITDTSGGATPSDGYHVKGDIVPTKDESNGVYYLTKEEYEAITAHPAADRHENFKVEVSVDSYEVDADGKKLTDVNGANSKQTITVDVQAVTDGVVLNVKEDTTQNGVTVVISDANKTAGITFDEDTSFNLANILAPAAFKDLDGSETRYLGLKGLPNGTTVTVDGVDYVIGQAGTPTVDFGGATGVVPAITIAGTATGLPSITITPPKDFSGDLTGIKVVLGALDSDSDSPTANPLPVTDEITINLHVKPVAGDLDIKGVTGNEDTAIAFLTGVKVTDASTATETLGEVITKVSFKLPGEWTAADNGKTWTNTAGQVWTLTAPTGTDAPGAGKYTVSFEAGEYVITFDASSTLTREEREEILGKFTLTPPAHSSKDVTLDIKVTSKDFSVISGGVPSAEVEVSGPLKVTVKPVAERADSSTNDGSTVSDNFDVKLNPSYVYTEKGEEDKKFNLGVDGSFKLSADWSNEDGKWVGGPDNWTEDTSGGRSEDTFALLTPYMTKNNDAGHDSGNPNENLEGMLEGSVFTYIDGDGETITLPFAGEPVKIPMQYLDSVQFKGPEDWSGVVKIKVQAGTIDYDEDDNAATKLEISGESWLTNLIIEPRADQVTLKVDTPIKTLEDTPVTLNIIPTSSDKNETFDVTISGIPKGATIKYWEGNEEKTFIADADNSSLSITNFDKTKQPELTPPQDSNEPISLTVKAESVDTLTYIDKDGVSQTVTHRDPSKAQELPINVEVQGVPDTPILKLAQDYDEENNQLDSNVERNYKTYEEDNDNVGTLEVALSDLVTELESGEKGVDGAGPDGSETITLRISDLPEGFTLTGAGPQLGAGSGTERVWVISKADLDKVQIVVPEHYSGTVEFTVQPVVTENDNPSEVFFDKQNVSFKVKPVAEASLSVSSNLLEDIVGQLSLTAVGADTDEYISEVRISAADVTAKGITLHAADGTLLTPGADDFYTFTYDGSTSQKAPDVYVKGPANHSGEIKLDIQYKVTDPSQDPVGEIGRVEDVTSEWKTEEHTLNFAPVTDKIDLSLYSVNGEAIVVGGVTTQTNPGTINVKLNIEQKADPNADASVNDGKDIDNSEQLTHILITGVPAGVSVKGAVETASGQWLMTIDSKKWDGDAILEHELEFVVSGYAAPFADNPITITTYSKDTGAASYEKDSVEWQLTYTRDGDEDSNDLPTVSLEPIEEPTENEDEPFNLNKVVGGTIGEHSGDYNVTLTIRTKEGDDTTFDGMTATQVVENGETITLWTKTEKVNTGESGQEKLEQMLNEIKVNTPKYANSNNLPGGKLDLDINLSVHADGISRDDSAKPEVVITPVTNDITIAVSTNIEGEGTDVALHIMLPTNTVDGELGAAAGWTIVDGKVYVHVADDGTGLKGQLTDAGGTALDVYTGTAPDGTPTGGKLYAVDADKLAGLKFVPDAGEPHQTGKLDITVLVKNQEIGASNVVVSTGTGSVEIQQSNSGYEATISAEGEELQGKPEDELIKLDITGQGLVDANETIDSAFISGLPDGFTVWVGEPATMASNAGSGTWAIPLGGNDLPANISIKPPKNWAGTLEDLKFTVMSGHTGLTPTASDIRFDLVVNPVANGIEMNPTLSFGEAGDKIELNLNASMKDPSAATGAKDKEGKLTDQYTELTELSLSGFPDGQKVQFFIGDSKEPLDASQATFKDGAWTITGLSQSDLQNLKFLHGEGSADIIVRGRTYEVDTEGNPYQVNGGETQYSEWSDAKTAAINISPTVPTSGADHFLWDGTAINGFGGEDTVQLRFGENLTDSDHFKLLKNIEHIDMTGSGDNSITNLTAQDVLDMTDERNELTISGDSVVLGEDDEMISGDTINLTGWTEGSSNNGYTQYTLDGATLNIQNGLNVIID